jgi:hypothetical protein
MTWQNLPQYLLKVSYIQWLIRGMMLAIMATLYDSAHQLEPLIPSEAAQEPLLAQARSHDFRYGFFDQTSQLWSRRGLLLATAHQIVYYKE